MGRRFVKFFVLLGLAANHGTPPTAGVATNPMDMMARAMTLAYRGELTEPGLIGEIEQYFQNSSQQDGRLYAAHLLTYAPPKTLFRSQSVYVNYLLSLVDISAKLGRDTFTRLVRMQADALYESGRFDKAMVSYQQLRSEGKGFIYEYATLKLGWCYLNTRQSERAFALWMAEIQSLPSASLFQSLGQALAENGKLSNQESNALAAFALNDQQKTALIDGIYEGVKSLQSGEQIRALSARISTFPWFEELVTLIFEKSSASGERACRHLAWLEMSSRKPWKFQPYGRMVQSCTRWVLKSKGRSDLKKTQQALIRSLVTLLPAFDLRGNERQFRFDLFRSIQSHANACTDGLQWISEVEPTAKTVPANDVAEACSRGFKQADKDYVESVLETIEGASISHLQNQSSPLVFVMTHLLEDSKFRDRMLDRMVVKPGYGESLLPTLLAERFYLVKNFSKAYDTLVVQMKSPHPESGMLQNRIWSSVLEAQISERLTSNKLQDVGSLLEKHFPLDGPDARVDAHSVRLWTAYLNRARHDPSRKEPVKDALMHLMTTRVLSAGKDLSPVLLEMAAELGLWQSIWVSVGNLQLPKPLMDRIVVGLFDAILSDAHLPDGALLTAELRMTATLARELKTRNYPAMMDLEPVGHSPLAEDLRFLKKLSRWKSAVLRRKKEGTIPKVISRARFLQVSVWRVHHRIWAHSELYRAALAMMEDFCEKTRQLIAEDSGDQTNLEWQQLLVVFKLQLEQCVQKGRRTGETT